MRRPLPFLLSALLLAPAAASAQAGSDRPRASRVVPSVFHVSKSENQNQVHYGLRVDEQCTPTGDAPVFARWRMLEEGPRATEPLLDRERKLYGLAAGQRVVPRRDGGDVILQLRSLQDRRIRIESRRAARGCDVRAVTTIGGAPSELHRAHVKLRFLGVSHVRIEGERLADGAKVVERYDP